MLIVTVWDPRGVGQMRFVGPYEDPADAEKAADRIRTKLRNLPGRREVPAAVHVRPVEDSATVQHGILQRRPYEEPAWLEATR